MSKFHRVDRVLSFFSSRRIWDSSTPLPRPQASVPPFGSGGGGDVGGGPNSDEGTQTLGGFIKDEYYS